jgi:hypothetical protein
MEEQPVRRHCVQFTEEEMAEMRRLHEAGDILAIQKIVLSTLNDGAD